MRLPGLGALLLLAASASGATNATDGTPAARNAAIHFVQYGGIRSWKADRNQGLWIQDRRRNWYYAKFMGRCFGLNFATSLAFDTRPIGTFDRFSSVIVPGEGRCMLQSFAASDGPPPRQKAVVQTAAEDGG